MCEIGASGRDSDNGAFARCKFGKMFYERKLPIPPPRDISQNFRKVPYVVVADDAFPLQENVMKPYSHRQLSDDERIFNYRLSRARRLVENSFGILVARWRIYRYIH
ncbi:PREDICTED: uncharacterized protein LOC108361284 [Rhagoletis zephyria]|uniref:uncharacterized protein LOC108361284 n=1 Tax=Rhagoletis zephyria TaxID=28612 RepID=UPI0008114A3F|nr:PREDICTED: uncharacterized protein LOC108361284 [Rhagoletis zephyria]